METKLTPENVERYISGYPVKVKKRLKELRAAIKKAAPDAEEKISYSMPAYTYKGMLLYFAAHKNHIGFYPMKSTIEAFKEELKTYNCSKGTVQFTHDKPIPVNLITSMVKYRVNENLAKAELKAKKKPSKKKTKIKVEVLINAPVKKTWKFWTIPDHIIKWNYASEDWHTPHAVNDLRQGGKFLYRMEAKDGSFGFDFSGTYYLIKRDELIEYILDDGRKVRISFSPAGKKTKIVETFEAEGVYPVDHQRAGWQSILDNFKNYSEKTDKLLKSK
jgi:uncharacterized protein YdhG (YjbR/CyaY superfamily)/uncharacterized protein YndB with AHSA1/START domain